MTVSDRWLLPDGVQDILPPDAERIEALRRDLLDLYHRWGYELIIPPMIEYLESLLTGTGNDLNLQTFKLTDQLSGRLMGVRADMTPQAARIDAHTLKQNGVTRLCYAGHVLHTRPTNLTSGRAPLQIGCELFGSQSVAADQEIILLMLQTLERSKIPGIHLDLAHVAIYQTLAEAAGLSPEQEARVFDAMRRKSIPELDELLGGMDSREARWLRTLARLDGDARVLQQARDQLQGAPAGVLRALDELQSVADRVRQAHPDVSVGFDFCELRGYNYHTGLVFAAYSPGSGDALAQGGRYDSVGRDFGRARPATGFSADLQRLTLVADAPATDEDAIWAPAGESADLQAAIAEQRVASVVIQALPDDSRGAEQLGCRRQLVERNGRWTVEPIHNGS